MRISGLFAENFKRLVAVELAPDGGVVQITGKNANGKSSCLDAISVALEGLEVCPGEPIRKGEKRAQIRVKLTGERELLVTRKFARKEEGGYTSSLTVESPDGAQFKSPQKLLDELLGELAFDPLAFTRMKAREQFDELRAFAPGIDFEKVDAENRGDYERRTNMNRLAREAEAAANMVSVPADTPDEPIDEAALTTELQAAGTLNQDVERRKALRVQAGKDVETYRDQAKDAMTQIAPDLESLDKRLQAELAGIDQQIAVLQRQRETRIANHNESVKNVETAYRSKADELTRKADELQARIDQAEELPALIDTNAIAEQLNRARIVNANVERKRQKAAHLATADKYTAEAAALTERMQAREKAKADAIAQAKMPVPGLGFGDGVVLLNGVPFAQASSAEQLRTSCAIAMAKNPKLRVCFIRDGSLLDEDGLRLIGEMSEQHQFQVFVERVDSSGKIGFVIEDGHVRAAERSAA